MPVTPALLDVSERKAWLLGAMRSCRKFHCDIYFSLPYLLFMISSFLKNSSRVFKSKQDTILSAAFVIAAVYTLSALLGFVKNRILSGYFGDSSELGIFFGADDIPSLLFSLTVSGSLAAAFIPVYTKVKRESEEKAHELTNSLLNTSLIIVVVLGIVVYFSTDIIFRF